jgi:hypothetical protein
MTDRVAEVVSEGDLALATMPSCWRPPELAPLRLGGPQDVAGLCYHPPAGAVPVYTGGDPGWYRVPSGSRSGCGRLSKRPRHQCPLAPTPSSVWPTRMISSKGWRCWRDWGGRRSTAAGCVYVLAKQTGQGETLAPGEHAEPHLGLLRPMRCSQQVGYPGRAARLGADRSLYPDGRPRGT